MNIIKRELQANLKSLMIWCISMIFLIYVGMIKYSGFQANGEEVNKMIQQMPQILKSAFGVVSLNVSKIDGYFAIFYLYYILIAAIHAAMLGSNIIVKEERDKTADFLFSKPISRFRIISAKLTGVLINLIIFNLITLIFTILLVNHYNNGRSITNKIFILMSSLFVLQLLYSSLGMFIAAFIKNIKKAASISTFVIIANYLTIIAIDLYDKLKFLKILTPFKYFPAELVMHNRHFEPIYFIVSITLILLFITGTYFFNLKKDLYA